jgi:hypothetical protein
MVSVKDNKRATPQDHTFFIIYSKNTDEKPYKLKLLNDEMCVSTRDNVAS